MKIKTMLVTNTHGDIQALSLREVQKMVCEGGPDAIKGLDFQVLRGTELIKVKPVYNVRFKEEGRSNEHTSSDED